MTPKLLLGGWLVVWCSLQVAHAIQFYDKNAPIACDHNGFTNKDGGCTCSPGFSSKRCDQITCDNYGTLDDEGTDTNTCSCPPGFLGPLCQPAHCVPGDSDSFFSPQSKQSVSLLVTYNTPMKDYWSTNNDNLFKLFCGFDNDRIFTVDYLIPVAKTDNNCQSTIEATADLDECSPNCQTLDPNVILASIQKAPSNSFFFIVSNVNISNNPIDIQDQIIGTAIAKRIKVNVIVHTLVNTIPLPNNQYDKDPGLVWLKTISQATLGNYITAGVDHFGNNATVIINQFYNFWSNDINVGAALQGYALPFKSDGDFYVSARIINYDQALTINGNGGQLIINTGFWKLYKYNFLSDFAAVSNFSDATIFAYTKNALDVYSALTTSLNTDAATATLTKGSSADLVVRVKENGVLLSSFDLKDGKLLTDGTDAKFMLTNRDECQFNARLARLTCTKPGVQYFHIVSKNLYTATIPIACLNSPKDSSKFSILDDSDIAQPLEEADDNVCTVFNEKILETNGNRSFIVVSSKNYEVTQNLYVNDNNIFNYLYSYTSANCNAYKSFYASLQDSSIVSNDFSLFLTTLLNRIPSDKSADTNLTNIWDILSPLSSERDLGLFSDVLFFIDTSINYTDKDITKINKFASERRLRIYFISVNNVVSMEHFSTLLSLASSTGGFAIEIPSYNQTSEFYDDYFSRLVLNDFVASGESFVGQSTLTLPDIYLSDSEKYTLLVTTFSSSGTDRNVTVTIDSNNQTAITSSNSLQIFNIEASSGLHQVVVTGPAAIYMMQAKLLVKSEDNNIYNLYFSDSKAQSTLSVSFGGGIYRPLLFNKKQGILDVSLTYPSKPNPYNNVYGGILSECGDSNVQYISDHLIWQCPTKDQVYNLKISDSTNQKTRTFVLNCHEGDDGDCLNGGTPENGVCKCALGWEGTNCNTPICLNNGTVTAANTCKCAADYSGNFCETSSKTCTKSSIDFRWQLQSLIVLIDSNELGSSSLLQKIPDLNQFQSSIYQYNCTTTKLILSTTDRSKIPSAFVKQLESDGKYCSPSHSIISALSNQITDRSLVIVISRDLSKFVLNQDLINALAATRTDLRVLTVQSSATDAAVLATIGNSIPHTVLHALNADSVTNYFNRYVASFFGNDSPLKSLNVFQSGTVNMESTITIPSSSLDNSKYTLFVHSTCEKINVAGEDKTPIFEGSQTFKIDDVQNNKDTVINFTSNDVCIYAIERYSYMKVAYTFESDLAAKESSFLTSSTSVTVAMSIYQDYVTKATTKSDPLTMPYVQISPINGKGEIGAEKNIISTKKDNSSCSYEYFSMIPACDSDTMAFKALIHTKSSKNEDRQQQVIISCHRPSDLSCGNGELKDDVCSCASGWTGVSCSEPICGNNGVRIGSVCKCNAGFSGTLCSSDTSATPPRVFVFVLDMVGPSALYFNMTVKAITDYYNLYSPLGYALVIPNTGNTSSSTFSNKFMDFNNTANSYFPQRNTTLVQSLTTTLFSVNRLIGTSEMQTVITSAISANIFILTQTKVNADDDPRNIIGKLEKTYNIETSAIYVGESEDILSSLKNVIPKTTKDVTSASMTQTLAGWTSGTDPDVVLPTDDPHTSCKCNVQTNIMFANDRSVSSIPNENVTAFVEHFKSAFYSITDQRSTGCYDPLPTYYQDAASFSAFNYYDGLMSVNNFCPSTYVRLSTPVKATNSTPDFSTAKNKVYLPYNLNPSCICARPGDESTKGYVIWLPRSKYTRTTEDMSLFEVPKNYKHMIVPVGYTSLEDDLYYTLAKNSNETPEDYIFHGVLSDSESVAQRMWAKICGCSL